MPAPAWARIESIYHAALSRPVADRQAFLDEACAGDEALRREVASLLEHAEGSSPLEHGALALAARLEPTGTTATMTGRRLGPYVVGPLLGRGGMGEVYRARDSRLGRQVAIKVLPRALATHPDRLARFDREARALASLSHPNVATIHGVEEIDGTRALVMELVDGETLADRLARGRLPLGDALAIARQIADALEAAHAKGIVHRDVKPGNVMLSASGVVKVLDFGLAKPLDAGSGLSNIETAAPGPTAPGMLLGTPSYMSPEQARGDEATKSTDIWSFGCVLFELLSGRQAFGRATGAEALAAVLEREPDWAALPPSLPQAIDRLLRRCLEKNPSRRLRDIGDARIEIEDALKGAPATRAEEPAPTPRPTRRWLAAAVVGAVALAALVVAATWRGETSRPLPETRLDVATPPTDNPASFALAPDGRSLAFVARDRNTSRLWLRSLSESNARPLDGTEGADWPPFWSPDGRNLGFPAGGSIKTLSLDTGVVRTLAAGPRNGAWAPDGTVLLGSGLGPLLRVPANGGAPVPATVLQGQQTQHWFPSMLPDGRRFLFYGGFGADVLTSGVFIGSLDAGKITRAVSQVQPGSSGWFVPPHWLLYVQQGSLLASRFDAERGTISGTPVRVAADIGDMTGGGVSVSPSGTIAYRPNVDFSRSQLTWFDRTGRALGTVGPAEVQGEPRVSPDATGVLTTRPQAIFLFDGRRLDRITVGRSGWPSWMPDGRRVVYSNGTSGRMDLWVKSIDETGDGVPFASSNQNKVLTSWTPDGGTALVDSLDPQDGMDLLVIDAAGDRRLRPWLKTRSVERGAQFSPDGRFVAYQSNQSGRFEVYVRPFAGVAPAPSRQSTISTGGGISPRWSPDGGEIYFIAPDGSMMAVPVKGQGNTLTVGPAERLFKVAIKGGGTAANIASNYDVARDGRFLVNVVNDDPTPIVIIQNWRPPEPSAPTP